MDQTETPPNIEEPATEPIPAQGEKPESRLEHRHINLKWLIIVFTIFFIIIVVFLIMHFNNQEATGQKEGIDYVEKPTGSQATPQSPEKPSQELSEAEIEQIKMEVITGKREDVPGWLEEQGEDRQMVIARYLYDCHYTPEIAERIGCYELYYFNNDEAYRQKREACSALSGNDMLTCLDSLYYYASAELSLNLCPAIADNALREECLTSIR